MTYAAGPGNNCHLLGDWPICIASLSNDATSAALMSSQPAANTITYTTFLQHNNYFMVHCRDYPGELVPEETSPTHIYLDHQQSFIIFLHLVQSIASSLFIYVLGSLFAQPLSRSSLVYLLVWDPLIHIPYISSHAHAHACMHAHTHIILWLSGLCPRLPGWATTRNNLDFTEARNSKWHWHQLGHMKICTSPQIDNHANITPLSFLPYISSHNHYLFQGAYKFSRIKFPEFSRFSRPSTQSFPDKYKVTRKPSYR